MTNRCLTSILSRNITGFHFVYQKLCTSDTPQTCKSMTATGLFSYCHRTNCSVNLCNNEMPAPTPPTTGRPTQQTNTTGSANSSVSTTVLTGVNNTPTSGCSANLLTATSWKNCYWSFYSTCLLLYRFLNIDFLTLSGPDFSRVPDCLGGTGRGRGEMCVWPITVKLFTVLK